MKAPKIGNSMLLLCISLLSCSKEHESIFTKVNPSGFEVTSAYDEGFTTINGLGIYNGGVDVVGEKLAYAGINLARTQVILSERVKSGLIDNYLRRGYNVQINLNWKRPWFGPTPYPTDLELVKSLADEFFSYYASWKDQIPIVVVENEWDNVNYHSGTIDDYLNQLKVITETAHTYGFKIADAGISGTSFRRWVYSKLDSETASQWKQWYWVGENMDNFDILIETVDYYTQAIQNIPIDYLNVHWYNLDTCRYGFETAANIYKAACNKKDLICNEFGIKLNSDELFHKTVDELNGKVLFAIAYSGNGAGNGDSAVPLTDAMLDALNPSKQ